MSASATKPNIVERITNAAEAHVGVALALTIFAAASWIFIPEVIKTRYPDVSELGTLFAALGLFASLLGPVYLFGHCKRVLPNNRLCGALIGTLQLGAMAVILYFLPVYLRDHGPRIPGAMFEQLSYESRLYVNLTPDGRKKAYHVPAVIEATWDESGDDEESHSWRIYKLKQAELPDGDLVEPYEVVEDIRLGYPGEFEDEDGQHWTIELTDQPAP